MQGPPGAIHKGAKVQGSPGAIRKGARSQGPPGSIRKGTRVQGPMGAILKGELNHVDPEIHTSTAHAAYVSPVTSTVYFETHDFSR